MVPVCGLDLLLKLARNIFCKVHDYCNSLSGEWKFCLEFLELFMLSAGTNQMVKQELYFICLLTDEICNLLPYDFNRLSAPWIACNKSHQIANSM